MENNIVRMAKFARECGVELRPHVKTHKVPEIAKMQLQAGSKGICVQKLSEAEVFAVDGITDIFITNEVVGDVKLDRLSRLAERTRLAVAVDNVKNIRDLNRSCSERGIEIDVFVDVDVGMNRCGVGPPQAAVLAKQIAAESHLKFRGVMGYEGHVGSGSTREERVQLCQRSMNVVADAKKRIGHQGITVDVVSVGSSVSVWTTAKHPDTTEIQPGMYIFNDCFLMDKEVATIEDCALTVLATVMSKLDENRAVIDAGSKAFQWDMGKFPRPLKQQGVHVVKFSEEHGWLAIDGNSRRIRLGDKLEFVPYHCCTCVNEHDEMLGVRDSKVEKVWPILARGKMK